MGHGMRWVCSWNHRHSTVVTQNLSRNPPFALLCAFQGQEPAAHREGMGCREFLKGDGWKYVENIAMKVIGSAFQQGLHYHSFIIDMYIIVFYKYIYIYIITYILSCFGFQTPFVTCLQHHASAAHNLKLFPGSWQSSSGCGSSCCPRCRQSELPRITRVWPTLSKTAIADLACVTCSTEPCHLRCHDDCSV